MAPRHQAILIQICLLFRIVARASRHHGDSVSLVAISLAILQPGYLGPFARNPPGTLVIRAGPRPRDRRGPGSGRDRDGGAGGRHQLCRGIGLWKGARDGPVGLRAGREPSRGGPQGRAREAAGGDCRGQSRHRQDREPGEHADDVTAGPGPGTAAGQGRAGGRAGTRSQ